MHGLTTITAALLRTILKSSAGSRGSQIQGSQSLLALSNFSFPPINSYYSVIAVPPNFETLFASSSTSSSTFTSSTRYRKEFSEISTSSVIASLCYHLLAILGNVLHDKTAIQELITANELQPLLDLLLLNLQSTDSSFQLVIQKQLVRTICILTATSTMDLAQITLIKDQVHHQMMMC
jgi:hypothetical protein